MTVTSSTRYFEETDCYLTKILMSLNHLFLVTIVHTTVLLNNELTAHQNQIGWNTKLNKYRDTEMYGLRRSSWFAVP
jgi:hypothetical protein